MVRAQLGFHIVDQEASIAKVKLRDELFVVGECFQSILPSNVDIMEDPVRRDSKRLVLNPDQKRWVLSNQVVENYSSCRVMTHKHVGWRKS